MKQRFSHGAQATLQNLLARPEQPILNACSKALAAAVRAFPIPRAHRADLPYAVRDLSRMLTAERTSLSQPYWAAPRYLSAYLQYFLPWNLYRLSWLLPSLELPLTAGDSVLDLGSGPLTLPLALWCTRPDLHDVPLHFVCTDVATKPMEVGRDIFYLLAGKESPWKIRLQRAPLEKALNITAEQATGFALVMAGNVLNELAPSKTQSLEQRLEGIMGLAHRRLAPGGRMLLVEPGTRLGGKIIVLARKGALHHGFAPLAPCTHSGPCPIMEQPLYYPASPEFSGWCHFVHPADTAPEALLSLGRKAQLEKDSLAMSCLFMHKGGHKAGRQGMASDQTLDPASMQGGDTDLDDLEALYNEIMEEDAQGPVMAKLPVYEQPNVLPDVWKDTITGSHGVVRVISDLIRLPDEEEPARYACSAKGLALLADAVRVPSGAGVLVPWPKQERRDGKTGALMLVRDTSHPQQDRERTPAPHGRPDARRAPGVRSKHDSKGTPLPHSRQDADRTALSQPRQDGRRKPATQTPSLKKK